MVWVVDNPLATPVRPVCSKCGAPMWLIRIEPEKPECPRCQNQMTEIIDLEKAA
jgi:uncharacterized paraquat-inducible protein A